LRYWERAAMVYGGYSEHDVMASKLERMVMTAKVSE
jgi:hypothetical protein